MAELLINNHMSPDILCVGGACLDIVNYCSRYPQEDSGMRAQGQKWCSGGNSMNTCKVLRLIGRQCELFGTLGAQEGIETE